MFRTILVSALALSALAPVAVQAGTPSADVPSTIVRYSDLDLSHGAGVAVLKHRIEQSVDAICGTADPRDLTAQAQIAACRHTALNSAMPQVAQAVDRAQQVVLQAATGTKIASR